MTPKPPRSSSRTGSSISAPSFPAVSWRSAVRFPARQVCSRIGCPAKPLVTSNRAVPPTVTVGFSTISAAGSASGVFAPATISSVVVS